MFRNRRGGYQESWEYSCREQGLVDQGEGKTSLQGDFGDLLLFTSSGYHPFANEKKKGHQESADRIFWIIV